MGEGGDADVDESRDAEMQMQMQKCCSTEHSDVGLYPSWEGTSRGRTR